MAAVMRSFSRRGVTERLYGFIPGGNPEYYVDQFIAHDRQIAAKMRNCVRRLATI
jgi:hypothetical protein